MMDFDGKGHYPIDLDQLPKTWAATWVGEVCVSIQSGFASGEHNSAGKGVPHLRPMNVDRMGRLDLSEVKHVSSDTDPRRLAHGDVLFNNTNSPVLIGKTCPILTGADLAFSNHMTRLRPSRGVDTRFLAHELHYLWMAGFFLHKCLKHVNQASVSTEVLRATVPVAIPPSPEQGRIVEAIETYFTRLDDAVAMLERVQRNLKRYRASVLKAAVEGRLVPTEAELASAERRDFEPASVLLERILAERRRRWEASVRKGRYQEPVAPDVPNLPELPEDWCWATIDQLTDGARSSGYGVLVPGPDVQDGVRLVRVGDINDGRVTMEGLKRIDPDIAQLFKRTFLLGGEVLISLVGTIGRTAVVQPSLSGANVARAVGVIPITSIISPFWVEHWLRSPLQRILLAGKAHEVARKTLNLEDVRAAHVALPPLEEQARIIERVADLGSIAEVSEQVLANSEARLARLRQAILKWAFEGKLADQDQNDEPATVLLERIKAERPASTPTTKIRSTNGRQRKTA